MKALYGGEQPDHQKEIMFDQDDRLVKKYFLLREAEDSLVGPAGTTGGNSDIPVGE
jgi:hypothetical protein